MKIVHISDLHFGRDGENLLPPFMKAMEQIGPDLVIVSGDFTQHASRKEFARAGAFLKSLPCPFFSVPGNHDVAGLNVWERLLFPYRRYRRFISDELFPTRSFPHAVIAGINSARRFVFHWNWANGAVGRKQLGFLQKHFTNNERRWKICVLHHPIHKVDDAPISVKVFGARRALRTLKDLKADLVLTGHVHHASITEVGDATHQTIYLSASTALSTRVRTQGNGFNVITLDEKRLKIAIYEFKDGGFMDVKNFERIRA
jgi:3',5'-cyclic AMP phosphodiesterase CpdA